MSRLNFERAKILVVGDVMIDRYLEGRISGISPEADVPVFRKKSDSHYLGGAANVAVNISNLGGEAILIGLVGCDDSGLKMRSILADYSRIHDHILQVPERITTIKTRIINENKHVIRIDTEDDTPINNTDEEKLIQSINNAIKVHTPNGLLFQDYNKGVLTPNVISHTITKCHKLGIKIYVDPKFENIENYLGVTVFKPNKKELEFLLQSRISIQEMMNGGELIELRKRLQCEYLVITISDSGIIYVDDLGIQHIPGITRKVIDVCGAGDTVISVIATALSCGYKIDETIQLANIAGGQVCEHSGVKPIDFQKLASEFLTH